MKYKLIVKQLTLENSVYVDDKTRTLMGVRQTCMRVYISDNMVLINTKQCFRR